MQRYTNRYNTDSEAVNPDFKYGIKVSRLTQPMWDWCETQPGDQLFDRWYIEWGSIHIREYDTVAFEREESAFCFALAWGKM